MNRCVYYIFIINILYYLSSSFAFAQEINKFLSLRYDEDYRFLAKDSLPNWYKDLKFNPLNKDKSKFVSQGGEVRYLIQYFKNEDWGDAPVVDYTSFYTRFLYHTDWHWSSYIRFFGQLSSTFANGRVTPNRGIDETRLDLHQAFLDVYFPFQSNAKLTLRVGRQELLYGSQRLIAVREGPNNRQSFDAVKLFYKNEIWQMDIFYAQPVINKANIFDDNSTTDRKVWSFYAVRRKVPILSNVDLYYIGNYNRIMRFNGVAGEELRHSFGTRIWHKGQQWACDLEALYQLGSWGKQAIRAYTASANVTYSPNIGKFSPTLGLKTEFISGDKEKDDQRLNTFNPLFPRGAYFGLAALIGPANLVDLHPSIDMNITSKLVFGMDYDIFWRYSLQDGIYGPNVVLIYGDRESKQAHIGKQLGISLEYTPNRHFSIVPEVTWFSAGNYLKEVSSGKDVLFGAVTMQFKY